MNNAVLRFTALMGSASIFTLTTVLVAHAQQPPPAQVAAQAASDAVPEQVLVTGSLIHGAATVGVPVTNLKLEDFIQTGNVTVADLFQNVPAAVTYPGASAITPGGHREREERVNLRGLDLTGPRTLLMVDGVRYPPQADGLCAVDPSIIPSLALDRVDILADGASASYGSDAIAGVINLVLKRGYEGAISLMHVEAPTDGGGLEFQGSQLWGHTWETGDITLTYEYINAAPIKGTVHSNYTLNYSPWGLDDRIPIGSSLPGTVSTGAPSVNNGAGVSGAGTVCKNCYSIPVGTGANFNASLNNGVGPLTPGSASTLNWATLLANPGVTNEVDPLQLNNYEVAGEQKNSFVATFDQRIVPGVSFFFTGFYANRRVNMIVPTDNSGGILSDLHTFTVPTTNPYYPSGAPAGLQVSYNLGAEYPPSEPAHELSQRYQVGFNLDLPFDWKGKVYDSRSYESNQYTAYIANDNAVSIALGNTVSGVSKPASVPYFNIFCDPTAYQCNSPQTLAYIAGRTIGRDTYQVEEKGAQFDGPLFDLPGGTVKAAIGGNYETNNVVITSYSDSSAIPLSVPPGNTTLYGAVPADLNVQGATVDSEPYSVWAAFGQLDIPIFGDHFNLPLARKLDLEVSWRHDQYSSPSGALEGGTSNPRIAFNWLLDETVGATVRGSWGTSFRFANAGEYSIANSLGANAIGFDNAAGVAISCTGGKPAAGSINVALVAAGFACGSQPPGITWGGGPQPILRSYVDATTGLVTQREGGPALAPETSQNYSLGFDFAPKFDFLRGLDVQMTYYSIKINNPLQPFNQTNAGTLSDPNQRFHFIVPSDLGCSVAANANPAACAPFEAMAVAALNKTGTSNIATDLANVYWISDGGTYGNGFLHVDGLDFSASYDFDLGDYGVWNTGITGNYQLHRLQQTVDGGPVVDLLHQTIASAGGVAQAGVETTPRLVYRARLGWNDGTYNVTGFMNYASHFYAPFAVPPNVNLQCTTAGGIVGGGGLPCAINNFTNYEPNWITFDLSLGYSTGETPANDYLKNLSFQFTVQNLLGKHPAFEYGPSVSAREIAAYDILKSNEGRVIGLSITKNW